ncbi:MAG: hypothetical protein PHT54_02495 [Candidatus Nanoarchaeia archaeon]|nr:hypothetical protein [Candidatus Nanoarchaeia archaeon]
MIHPRIFLMPGFEIEIIYSFIIIVSSLMIYFKTKELYNLTTHKGIKYFRDAFLFFAVAFFIRFIIFFLLTLFEASRIFEFNPRLLGSVSSTFFIYTSTMAIVYLLYSMIWEKWDKNSKKIGWIHIGIALVSAIGVAIQSTLILLILQCLVISVASLIAYRRYIQSGKKKGVKSNLTIYILLFIFWVLNTIGTLTPDFFSTSKIIIYLVSIGTFLSIFYAVIKRTG